MEKIYDTYKDSGVEWIGKIPENWDAVKIKYLTDIYTGNSLNSDLKEKYQSENLEDLPYVSTKDIDIDNNSLDYDSGLRIPLDEGNYKVAPKGSFLLCVEGANAGKKLAYVEHDCYFVNKLACFTFPNKYLYYYSQSHPFKSQFFNSISGLIGGVATSVLKEFISVLPSPQEQTQIAAYLDYHTQLIDTLIEKIEKSKEVLKEYRLSLVEKVLIDNKVNRTQLRHVVNLINRPIEYNDEEYFTKIGMYNWNRGLFLYPKTLGQDLGDSKFQIIKDGDLIISGQFAWEGAVSLVTDNENDCIASHRFHVLNGKNDIILNEYLMAYFTSQEGHLILNDNSNGSAGRNRPLNINNLLKEKIPVPNLDIQLEIKKVVKKEQKNIVYSSKIIQKLKDYRQSLISEAVTGKIDVREWQQPNT